MCLAIFINFKDSTIVPCNLLLAGNIYCAADINTFQTKHTLLVNNRKMSRKFTKVSRN